MKLKDINPFSIEYRVEEQDLYHYTNLTAAREIVKISVERWLLLI